MAKIKYVSPENLEAVETGLKGWIVEKIDTAISQLIDNAPEAMDTLKEISDYISTHKDEYTALVTLVADKASKTDVTALQTALAKLETQISGSSHSHTNQTVLDNTTASFTTALLTKLNGLANYDDTEIKQKIETIETDIQTAQTDIDNLAQSIKPMTSEEIDEMFNRVFNDSGI